MEITILVKSSQVNPYAVSVLENDAGLSIFCDCQAGQFGKFCKHKLAIVLADETILYDDDQMTNFNQAVEVISRSRYPTMAAGLREAEIALEAEKKRVKKQKDALALGMKKGLK